MESILNYEYFSIRPRLRRFSERFAVASMKMLKHMILSKKNRYATK